ncbi:MAG TPA: four helix bundle protein [Gemmataceae bacterium]|jgi:four helix bundle protein|nr:four helix bundle protein [Gemmataceae bacterium]
MNEHGDQCGREGDGPFQARTKEFAVRVVPLTNALPHGRAADVIGKQLLRSATSVGPNYRTARDQPNSKGR